MAELKEGRDMYKETAYLLDFICRSASPVSFVSLKLKMVLSKFFHLAVLASALASPALACVQFSANYDYGEPLLT